MHESKESYVYLLKDNVQVFVRAYSVIVFNNVWMVQPFHQLDLSLE